ncbi:adenylate/guanylate cyclase domain-containing protein [Paramagnetospirillum kuznetsovii]|uniref:Adenylate/guanylate cyclase domain-containing protein n=1 Tax=Paramagnetospirillum kuznetsovii TaxID=2053833 RepID=A0A364P032_9PROT|nr:adenylate/guanylate cyclase domain-containing protein [Paramagnetospirillum kuznetsovii]RAU22691.1 adenylate/guanylate cyclase domain-containing protein [Paramagnetospirillum kuznetsovii]
MSGLSKRYDIILTILLFLVAIPAQHFEWFALLEDQTLSFRHQLRLAYGDAKTLAVASEVVVVNVDEPFFKAYKSFPLRRTDIGTIVTNLKELGAKVVAVDMLMDFPSSYNEDPALAKALKDAGNTILVAQGEFRDGKFVKINYPTEMLDQASASAYTNIQSNSKLVTTLSRLKVYPELTGEKGGWPFAVRAAALFLGVDPRLEGNTLVLGGLRVPLDHNNLLYIDFPPLPTGTRFLSQSAGIGALEFLDIAGLNENERSELEFWVKDKIVILGDTSEVSHDWFDTPVGMVYGVEIIADSVSSILKGAPLRAVGPGTAAASALVVMMIMLVLTLTLTKPMPRGLCVIALGGGFFALSTGLYIKAGQVLPTSYVVLAIIISYLLIEFRQYLIERNQKQQIAKTFGQYIPPELVAEMNKTGQSVQVGGESREMTVLFSDVRGFTTISEGLAPQELTVLMNAFLSPMTHVIHDYRGTIDKYMGDAIMAFWGAPLHDPDHAKHAIQAALKMVTTMEDLKEDFIRRGWKPIKVGIGLNTGIMNVGNMGSDFRMAYTVLGDAVNLGSRIESLTKQYGVNLMISEFTQAAVPGLISRELDMVRVKGKNEPVRLYEPLGFDGEIDNETLARISHHHGALALFREQRWDGASATFQMLAAEEPERVIYKVYLDRIEHFREEPPGADWDGVYTHKEKS